MSLSPAINENALTTKQTPSSLNISSNINLNKRPLNDSFYSPQQKKKKKSKQISEQDNASSSDIQSDDDDYTRLSEPIKTPTFKGRRLVTSATIDSPVNANVDKESYLKYLENKYLIPIMIAQERTEKMMKCLYNNQLKIQKILNKKKV
jgi:hypothetical protein